MNLKSFFALVLILVVSPALAFAAGRPTSSAHVRLQQLHNRTPRVHHHSIHPHH
jgi:hypothetical protein